ncbi:MAG TPA: o-succinylbenzoate synthase [Actinomycetota bacterium]|nr:o-succinylbenzoate synthase [Actinomycetota bacterium]
MKLQAVELRRIAMPLVDPLRTSFGSEAERDILLVRAVTSEAEGWGECVASTEPLYSSEYVDGAQEVIERFFLPRLFAHDDLDAAAVGTLLDPIKGHRMAKGAVEMAVLDAELRAAGMPLAEFLGGARDEVDCGVSIGIQESIPELLDSVGRYLEQGYRRVKLKIEPGWDLEPVATVRERFGDDLLLQVDANTAYTVADGPQLAKLDAFDLLLIEQPLFEEDIAGHAVLAKQVRTPICLDESITSAKAAADAVNAGACRIVNIKAGRVGGYLEARRVHDVCQSMGVPVWCGGMLETGLGRAANVALASLPNFTLPGDTSASSRYWATDITEPFVLRDGRLRVPEGPGLGVEPIPEILERFTQSVRTIERP